jgi:hypothetical protein
MTVNPDLNPGDITNDPIVNIVVKKILDRHIQGMEKFGKTMSNNKRPMSEWVDETIEELLDAVHYLTKMKSMFQEFDTNSDKVKIALKSLEEGKTSTHEKTETQS